MAESKKSHCVRSPMQGNTPPMKTPSLDGSGGGTVIVGSSPKPATIQSPLNGRQNVKSGS